ncbi:Rv3235 family protein [Propionibacteriaceae bacterium Y2011]|uniref:Rv3235 family protein n=1 Tax=Microlunatus sp. Y2014 TaxID=3418488 RepID=UPI003B48BD1C
MTQQLIEERPPTRARGHAILAARTPSPARRTGPPREAPPARTYRLPSAVPIGGPATVVQDPPDSQPMLFADLSVPPAPGPARPVAADRVRQVAVVVVEVLAGRRAPTQLTRWVSELTHAQIVMSARRLARPVNVHVASVHCQHVTDDVIEASVRVRGRERSIAMAFQLQRTDGRWMCTAWEHRTEDLAALDR